MSIVINEDNLQLPEIEEHKTKVRAFLVDSNDNVLVANYGDVFLLPGGSVDEGENLESATIRELHEETGADYSSEDLDYLDVVEYYQKDYPKREGITQNRLVKTHYYVAGYKGLTRDNQTLTEKEQKDNFRLELIPLRELEERILSSKSNNPRSNYFAKELLAILEAYRKKYSHSVKKRTTNNSQVIV